MKKTIVIGDVHGCIDELKALLDRAKWEPNKDRVICVGDLVDRGPDPNGVVRFCRNNGIESVMGNHEEKHLRWWANEAKAAKNPKYKNQMRRFDDKRLAENQAFSHEDREWMAKMPVFVRLLDQVTGRNWIVSHAGIPADKLIEDQDPKTLIRTRWVDQTTGAYASGRTPYEVPENSLPWQKMWKGPESVVHGHIVQKEGHSVHSTSGFVCVNLDSGCVFGGSLSAMVLGGGRNEVDLLSVPAARVYYENRHADE